MRSHADTQEDRAVELTPPVQPRAPRRVAEVKALPGFRLHVRFIDGTEGTVEMADFVNSAEAGVFAALRDENLFRQARVALARSLGRASWTWRPTRCTRRSSNTESGSSDEIGKREPRHLGLEASGIKR